MSKKPVPADDLSEAAIIERAMSMANQWMWAISLQHDRITNPRPEDKPFHPFGRADFNESDVHFLVIALRRLRAVATTMKHSSQAWQIVGPGVDTFDNNLPWLKTLRDVFEHLQDYAVDSNARRSKKSRRELQVWSMNGTSLNWLGFDIDWNKARKEAQDLYAIIKKVTDDVAYRQAP